MHTIKMFLKFGQEDNIKDLYHNGTIYMNPIQHFREIEDDELRGDLYEGVSKIRNYFPGQFEIPSIGYKGSHLGIHLRQSYKRVVGNIYSLFCISSHGWDNPNDFKIDNRIKRFGTHCLMVKDNQKFLELIENKLKEINVEFQHGFIDYYDKKVVNREISLFEKPLEFKYQNEFRFYLERISTKPFIFTIGSLTTISELYPTDLIVSELKLQTTT